MKKTLFWILLFFSIITQSLFAFPFFLGLLLIFYIFNRSSSIFFAAFIFGLVLDIITLESLGKSSLFFLIFLFVISLYESKFETKTLPFVLLVSFFGSFIYLFILGQNNIILISFLSSLFCGILFLVITGMGNRGEVSKSHRFSEYVPG